MAAFQVAFQFVPQPVGFGQRLERSIRPVEFLLGEELQSIPEHDCGREHGLFALATERCDTDARRIGGEANAIRQIVFVVIGQVFFCHLFGKARRDERKLVDLVPAEARSRRNGHRVGERKHRAPEQVVGRAGAEAGGHAVKTGVAELGVIQIGIARGIGQQQLDGERFEDVAEVGTLDIGGVGHLVIEFGDVEIQQANECAAESVGFPVMFFGRGDDVEKFAHPLFHEIGQQIENAHHDLEFLGGMVNIVRDLEVGKQGVDDLDVSTHRDVLDGTVIEGTLLGECGETFLENAPLLSAIIEYGGGFQHIAYRVAYFTQHTFHLRIVVAKFDIGSEDWFGGELTKHFAHPLTGHALGIGVVGNDETGQFVDIPSCRALIAELMDESGRKRLLIEWGSGVFGRRCSTQQF